MRAHAWPGGRQVLLPNRHRGNRESTGSLSESRKVGKGLDGAEFRQGTARKFGTVQCQLHERHDFLCGGTAPEA